MSQLMLVNPRRRKRRSGKRKMSALQASYFGGGRKRRRSSGRKRRRAVTVMAANPARRHRRRSSRIRVSRRRFRRNPISLGRGFNLNSFLNNTLMPASVGAAGALASDLTLQYANPYLPAVLQSGIGNSIARILAAVGVGYVASMGLGRMKGEQAMAGAVTVVLYDLAKANIGASLGLQGLGGYNMGWVSPAMQTGVGMNGLGMYVGQDNRMSGLGMYVGETESDYINSY